MKSDYHQPIFVPAHSGKKLEFLAVTHKLTGPQTGGANYLFESAFGPGAGNQLHVHRREDEVGYVGWDETSCRNGKNSKREKGSKTRRVPTCPQHALLGGTAA